jgi:hypothetical protein
MTVVQAGSSKVQGHHVQAISWGMFPTGGAGTTRVETQDNSITWAYPLDFIANLPHYATPCTHNLVTMCNLK